MSLIPRLCPRRRSTATSILQPAEWTDGLFTSILRKIVDNLRGEDSKRHWIVFDGDVDPEWVENLNSVLDDNKLLTLPNGERLNLPPNVRIMVRGRRRSKHAHPCHRQSMRYGLVQRRHGYAGK